MASSKDQSLADLTALFGQLSDQTRLTIVFLLAKGDCDVTSLVKVLRLKQPSVSHHLGLLRMNRLVVSKRKGKQIIYSLAENFKTTGGKLKISLVSHTLTVEGH